MMVLRCKRFPYLFSLFVLLLITSSNICLAKSGLNAASIKKIADEVRFDTTKTVYRPREFNTSKSKDPSFRPSLPKMESLTIILKMLSYLIVVVIIGIIIYMVFNSYRDKKVNVVATDYNIDDIQDIEKVNFEKLLSAAIAGGDFRLAIRIQYLIMLQKLQLQNVIIWKPNKTNRAYLKEIINADRKGLFSKASLIFESAWYGNHIASQNDFEMIAQLTHQIIGENYVK